MRIVGYVRVSLEGDVGDVLDGELQEHAIRRWAMRARHRLVSIARDDGATALEERSGLAEVLVSIQEREAEAVAVVRLDRLGPDVILQERIVAEVRRAGGAVITIAAEEAAELGDEPADPSRALVRRVLAAGSGYERAMRELRARYRLGRRSLLPADREHAALRRIEGLAEEGADAREIVRVLTAEGYSPRFSHRWDLATLRRLVGRARGRTA